MKWNVMCTILVDHYKKIEKEEEENNSFSLY